MIWEPHWATVIDNEITAPGTKISAFYNKRKEKGIPDNLQCHFYFFFSLSLSLSLYGTCAFKIRPHSAWVKVTLKFIKTKLLALQILVWLLIILNNLKRWFFFSPHLDITRAKGMTSLSPNNVYMSAREREQPPMNCSQFELHLKAHYLRIFIQYFFVK